MSRKIKTVSFSFDKQKQMRLFVQEYGNTLFKQDVPWNVIRPKITGDKTVRLGKDLTYLHIRYLAKKHSIIGQYLGLAAAYFPEIYLLFKNQIKGKFVTAQNHHIDRDLIAHFLFDQILTFFPFAKFDLYHGDILDYMSNTKEKFAIIDLDFMLNLSEKMIYKTIPKLDGITEKKTLLAIWHFVGRNNTKKEVDNELIPLLKYEIERKHKIHGFHTARYFETSPMRCEIAIISTKAA